MFNILVFCVVSLALPPTVMCYTKNTYLIENMGDCFL